MNTPGVEFMREKQDCRNVYSLIWNAVEFFSSLEAINQRPHKSSLLVVPNFIWIGEEIVCRERIAKGDNTPERVFWMRLCCLYSGFVHKDVSHSNGVL